MAVGVTKIASYAKVSKALVSRYLNGDPKLYISEDAQNRIEVAKKKLGISGQCVRQGGRSNFAYNIVMPVNYVLGSEYLRERRSSPFIVNLAQVVRKQGFRLSAIFFHEENVVSEFTSLINDAQFCDALVLGSRLLNKALAELIITRHFPHVSIDPRSERLGVNTLCAHAVSGFRQALEHLLELGHRRIGYFGDKDHKYPEYTIARAGLGLEASGEYDCIIDKLELAGRQEPLQTESKRHFGEWLDRGIRATAMICLNDEIALGAIDAMRDRSLKPGKDISIVGYDNIELRGPNPSDDPILTTIDNPVDILGERCGELILNQLLHGQSKIVHELIPVKLVVRKTTGPPE